MSQSSPLEVLNRMTLTEHAGRATVTLEGAPINATLEERGAIAAGHTPMQKSFKGTLDRLAENSAKA
jgi:DNA replicative helicase MCM subunit Mcm2 (Cdc46/Mcm family)